MGRLAAVSLLFLPALASAQSGDGEYFQNLQAKEIPRWFTEEQLESIEPVWPNPYLSLLPSEAQTDWNYWRSRARADSLSRAAAAGAGFASLAAVAVSEGEPNDTQATANPIDGFGTGDGEDPSADITGSLTDAVPSDIGGFPEDDGSIPLARDIGLTAGAAVRATGVVGDGPFGGTSGDFDFFLVGGVVAGDVILVDVDTPIPFGALDPYVVLYDSTGVARAANDDDGSSFDSFLEFTAPANGDYYVSIGGYGSFALSDPFDSSSGRGSASEGSYAVTLGLTAGDVDFFSMELVAGDIVGASVSGAATRLDLFDPAGALRIGSRQDVTFIHPAASPLPGGGNAVLSNVIETSGTYAIRVNGDAGAYALTLRVFTNPLLEASAGEVQTLFVDFDGAVVDASRFGGFGLRTLSPLSSFLGGWGLNPADEDAVIDAILNELSESISADVRSRGNNGDFDASGRAGEFDIEILNSRDHPDPVGVANVSRVIVGGTIPELGIGTIGIAESIDVGNFETQEVAVVLLDLLSNPSASNPNSLNRFPRAPGVSIIDVIAAGVGNIVAHEAGHYLGNWHTENFLTLPNIMDQGGNLENIVGVGADGIFGTPDDIDVDFGPDQYVPNEGFTGTEDTLNTVSFGLPTPVVAIELGFDVMPGNDENPLNPGSMGIVRVAILGSEGFDVRDIDPASLIFGPAGAAARTGSALKDVNGDGFEDRDESLDIEALGLEPTSDELCFAGETFAGEEVFGCDSIRAVPLACDFGALSEGMFVQDGPPNGGFESGDFTGWQQINSGSGGIAVADASFLPVGPGGRVVPVEGVFAAVTFQTGPGRHTLITDVTLGAELTGARLVWSDHLENHAGIFSDPNQEWRVEVWDPSDNSVLAELHSTQPGDAPFQDWTAREADLSPWIGRTIRLAFTQQDNLSFFNARLDDVHLLVRRQVTVGVDVRPSDADNVVNPASAGVIPVAVLGSASFGVTDVDVLTLSFGPGNAPPAHAICEPGRLGGHIEDLDNDGFEDLLVHFKIPATGIAYGDTDACVRGATQDGLEFEGCDEIRTIGGGTCGLGFELSLLLPGLVWLRRRQVGSPRQGQV